MARPRSTYACPPRKTDARGKRFVLIASEFHKPVADTLVKGAMDILKGHGASSRNISLKWVPGAFELPVVAAKVAHARPRPDAIIALGAVIRGSTSQYQVIANAVAQGLSHVSVTTRIPVTFGIIVAEILGQVRQRSGGSLGNRGSDAALAALAVLRLFDRIDRRPGLHKVRSRKSP